MGITNALRDEGAGGKQFTFISKGGTEEDNKSTRQQGGHGWQTASKKS